VLTLTPAPRIFVAVEPIDMRKSFNGLYAAVQSVLGEDVLGGHLYVFTNRRRNRVKAMYWDGSGLVIYANQPSSHYTSCALTCARCGWLGVDLLAGARSTSRSHRLQCFVGRSGPGSS